MLVALTFSPFCGYNDFMAGKPKKPELRKDNVLRIRMRDTERELLDRAAMQRSLETSSWARSELVLLAKRLLKSK